MKKIAIIGSGPAGIYTSLLLENFEGQITLFEQNQDIGKKLKITGGGRMNVTNKIFSSHEFSSNEKNLLKKIFKNPHFKNREEILKKLGIEYVWEDNRAILKSKNAVLEVSRLQKKLQNQKNLEIKFNSKVEEINHQDKKFKVQYITQNQKKSTSIPSCLRGAGETIVQRGDILSETFDIVILSQGGMYRMGDLKEKNKIYKIPLNLGHSITETRPSLGPLKFKNKKLAQLSGISLKVELKDIAEKISITDSIVITHFGISGPASLDFSTLQKSKNIEINFLPEISEEDFQKKFTKLRNGKNSLKKFLQNYLPKRLISFHLENAEIINQNFIADISKEKLKNLKKSLFHFEITNIEQNSYPSTWTTKGGINLKEIKTNTFESKLTKNLFFAGEILDINGLCGGYNISFAAISAQIIADKILKK